MTWKPAAYPSVSPYLLVRDAEATLAFLSAVFGAGRLRVIHRPDGSVMHAEARIDDCVVMMGEVPDPTPSHIHVYLPDIEQAYARALAAGGTSVEAPVRKDDDDMRGGVADADGHVWWLATRQLAR